jgi:hypothetical protein
MGKLRENWAAVIDPVVQDVKQEVEQGAAGRRVLRRGEKM